MEYKIAAALEMVVIVAANLLGPNRAAHVAVVVGRDDVTIQIGRLDSLV